MSEKKFNIVEQSYNHDINYRDNPMLYEYSEDCRGMYICQPYKEELLSVWKFLSIDAAKISAESIYNIFLSYLKDRDFVGSDVARKYLQAGSTKTSIPLACRAHFDFFYKEAARNEAYILLMQSFKFKQQKYKDLLEKEKNESW